MKQVGIIEDNIITGVVYGEVEMNGIPVNLKQDADAAYAATKRVQKATHKKTFNAHTQLKK